MTEAIGSKATGKWRRPGFLLEPLGWVQDRLSKAIEVEPRKNVTNRDCALRKANGAELRLRRPVTLNSS